MSWPASLGAELNCKRRLRVVFASPTREVTSTRGEMARIVRSTDASPQMNARIALAGALMTTVALAKLAFGHIGTVGQAANRCQE
jgi:hypothetical protein